MVKLTPKQEAFIEEYKKTFDDGDKYKSEFMRMKAAAKRAGYSEGTNPTLIIDNKIVADEISKFMQRYLALHTSKATHAILGIIDDPTKPGNKEKLAAAKEVLDRGGVAKNVVDGISEDQVQNLIIIPTKTQEKKED